MIILNSNKDWTLSICLQMFVPVLYVYLCLSVSSVLSLAVCISVSVSVNSICRCLGFCLSLSVVCIALSVCGTHGRGDWYDGWSLVSSRLITIRFRALTFNINIVQNHAPSTERSEGEVEEVYQQLKKLIDQTLQMDMLVVRRVSNAKIGKNHINSLPPNPTH